MSRRPDGKTDRTKPIIIVCGGQWGSEAKGMVAAELCKRLNIDYAVRTGGINAGHTVIFHGQAYKMCQLPTGWVNPSTNLVIGPGAYINPYTMHGEIMAIDKATEGFIGNRLYIDPRAGVHTDAHTSRSAASDRHHKIGATGKGVSEAIIDRIKGRGDVNSNSVNVRHIFGDGAWAKTWFPKIDAMSFDWISSNTEWLLNHAYDDGKRILLEGTQGQHLDLLLGPWPYTTHKPTGPAQWMVENGLSPSLKTEVVMVVRTYPIRVAGNSGPMPGETTWARLAKEINEKLVVAGGRPLIAAWALERWTETCNDVAEEWTMVPVLSAESNHAARLPRWTDTGRPNWRFDLWSAKQREQYAVGLSEFHAEVFRRLDEATKEELGKLFEFTTVTRKLRRVAEWNEEIIADSVRQMRPAWAVLTFLNYEFPELWGVDDIDQISPAAARFIAKRQKQMGVEIKYVTTGPEGRHMIEIGV